MVAGLLLALGAAGSALGLWHVPSLAAARSSVAAVSAATTGGSAPAPAPTGADRPSAQPEPPSATQPASSAPSVEPTPDVMNVLVLGLDRRGSEIPRSDMVMLVRLDLKTGRVGVVSVPRDLQVSIPSHGEDRINAAWAYGEASGQQDGGPRLARETVERAFGVHVDHYVAGDFACFVRGVDALGGVDVDVPAALAAEVGGGTALKPGPQHMDGKQALEYVRNRDGDPQNDFGRIERQHQMLLALRDEVRQQGLGAVRLVPGLVQGCRDDLRTDLGAWDLARTGLAASRISNGNVQLLTIPHSATQDYVRPDGAWVLQPRWAQIAQTIHQVFPEARVQGSGPVGG